ncbi:hypothetical protein B0T22DRAFT_201833 [Podospora appendiculata]|uniref:Uncharacterized protein n=1 Tax=Podospora appendiculata TaxID=314037 RepID=A0AAE1C9W8_9PEZI|nr:hypothetical protein B0T22DRAFT_201833 [Podospora appendiculata]
MCLVVVVVVVVVVDLWKKAKVPVIAPCKWAIAVFVLKLLLPLLHVDWWLWDDCVRRVCENETGKTSLRFLPFCDPQACEVEVEVGVDVEVECHCQRQSRSHPPRKRPCLGVSGRYTRKVQGRCDPRRCFRVPF